MAFTVRAEEVIEGADELIAALRRVAPALQKRYLKKAQNENGKQLLRLVKGRTPKRSGQLKRSLGRKVKVYRESGVVVALVGARQGFRIQGGIRTRGRKKGQPHFINPTKYLHLVELGTTHSQARRMINSSLAEMRSAIKANLTEAMQRALGAAAAKEAAA